MSPKSMHASFSTQDVRKACEKKLNIRFSDRGTGWFEHNGIRSHRISVHAHPNEGIAPKTFNSMAG